MRTDWLDSDYLLSKEGTVSLNGKTALVTGSSRGIGRSIALRLADEGANIVLNYFRKRGRAEETAQEIQTRGARVHIVKANVGELEDLDRLFEEAHQAFGDVDIFVSNAASGVLKPALEIGDKEWNWTVDINAKSLLYGAQRAAVSMKQKGWGRIISLTSLGSVRVFPEYSIVGVSKAAIEALTRYLAVELAPYGITVNAVSPGVVETEALNFFPSKDQMLEWSKTRTPMGRLVTPQEVARVVTFLCSEDAAMICGQIIHVDGGYSIVA